MTKIDMRDAFFKQLVASARIDNRIVFLSADHGAFALKEFEEDMPDRYINIGIAEQNMVGVAAGLAASGKIVFIYGISPFVSLRVLEQLTIDVAAMQLPVNVISVGAGFTYSTDGPTHHGLQDISAIATIPGITILNSSDPVNTRAFVEMAISSEKPHYIRIEKEKLNEFFSNVDKRKLNTDGYSTLKSCKSKILIISTGLISHLALEIAEIFSSQNSIEIAVFDVFRIKPLSERLLDRLREFKVVIVLEESYKSVLASELALQILDKNLGIYLTVVTCGEKFFFQGSSREEMLREAGLSKELIIDAINKILEKQIQ